MKEEAICSTIMNRAKWVTLRKGYSLALGRDSLSLQQPDDTLTKPFVRWKAITSLNALNRTAILLRYVAAEG